MLPDNTNLSPSSGPVNEAISLLVRQRDSFLAQAKQIDEIIANLKNIRSVPRAVENSSIPDVVPDQYKGMKLSPAFEAYMKARRGFKIPLAKVIEDLKASGVELVTPGSKNSPKQNLKITIHFRPKMFTFDEKTELVWLADTADLPPKKRKR